MSKNEPLTAAHMSAFRPSRTALGKIDAFLAHSGKQRSTFRVLDWGCGRGCFVAALLERGFDAYGVDIDRTQIEYGGAYFAQRGWRPETRLRVLDVAGPAPFDDGFFDCVVSQQVLEHVSDLGSVAAEMGRITRRGGDGFHIFPGRLRPIEGHLRMPLVHWLGKDGTRRAAIRAFTHLGIEPRWPLDRQLSARQRADVYYEYSVAHTFYRPVRDIVRTFEQAGLSAHVVSAFRRMPSRPLQVLGPVLRNGAMNALLSTFYFVDLQTRKQPAQ